MAMEDEKSVPQPPETTVELSPAEKAILDQQLHVPVPELTFFSLYRYASAWDWAIIAGSALCAIAAGAALPLFTVLFGNLTLTFQKIVAETISYDAFHHDLTKNVVYFIYLGVGEFVTIYLATVGFIYTGDHVTQKIRVAYLRAILRQNVAFFDSLGAGEITTRITADMNLIQDGMSEKVGLALTGLSTFVTAFIIAYVKFWKLALICTATLVALLLIMGGGSIFGLVFSKQAIESYGRGGSLAEDILDSIRTVVAFGAREKLAKKYDAHLREAEGHGTKVQISFAMMIGALFCVMYLNYGLGFWMGSRFLVDEREHVDVGDILTILMAVMLGSYNLGNVAPHGQAFSNAVAAASKIYSTIDRHSPLDPSSTAGGTVDAVKGSIELQRIRHVYPSRPEVLVMEDLSIVIPAGKTTAFVGPSGSGKSTIIGLIERFYSPVAGKVYLDGHDIQTLNLRWLRQQVSLVSQEPRLFATTIFENIRFGLIGSEFENEPREKLDRRIKDAARMANAHDFIMALPSGYDTHIGGFSLSGGQKQRIAIARAVVKDPKILLLDEATSALDTKSEGLVQAALDKAAEGRTTIVIAHRLSTIKTAHNIVVLVGGRIAEQGTHDELVDRKGIYLDLVEAQRINEGKDEVKASHEKETEALGIVEFGATEEDGSDIALNKIRSPAASSSYSVQSMNPKKTDSHYRLWTLVKFIAAFNKPERYLMGLGLMVSTLAGGIQPSQAVLFAKAVSTLTLPPTEYPKLRHDANFWSLMFLTVGIVTFILYCVQGTFFAFSSEKLIRRARSRAFRAMLRQDISFFDDERNSTGALTSSLSTEIKQLSGISGVTLGTILIVIVNLIASLTVALIIGWKLALVCISAVPVLLGCGFLRVWMLARFQTRAKTAYQKSANSACEAASAIRTVASLTMENEVLATYHSQLRQQVRADLASILKSSLLYASSQSLQFFCMALGFWYGGTLLGRHEYSLFTFYVCFSEVIFGAQAAGTIFSHAPDMGKAKSAAAEVKRLFDRKPRITSDACAEPVHLLQGSIAFQNVHFRYPTRPEPVLQGVTFAIQPGQYVALVGASGSGKSTIIALLERFYDAVSGDILVDGKVLSTLHVDGYRRCVALVGQEPALFQGSIKENLLLGSPTDDVSEETLVKACKDANIYDFILSLPQGFDTLVGSKGGLLSGGQKQRLAIARALLRDPRILLLDEATSALDSESEKTVQAALDAAARGRTTVAVAHRLSTIQRADVIFVLERGRVVESGSHAELMRRNGRYFELVNLQRLG